MENQSQQKITNLEEFKAWFKTLYPCQRKLFWVLHRLIIHFEGYCYASQSKLAKLASITREYVCRVINFFVEKGILKKTYRHNETCVYELPEMLKIKNLKECFKHKFSLCGDHTKITQVLDIPTEFNLSRYDNESISTDSQKNTVAEQNASDLIPYHLQKLGLHPVQAADFLGFSEAAVDYALNYASWYEENHGALYNKAGYFYRKCKDYCEKANVEINKKAYSLKYKVISIFK